MKTCSVDNCINPVFAKMLCRSHQWKRTDRKPKKIAVRTQGSYLKDFGFGFDNQTDLFEWLWENAKNEKGEVFCKYTGIKLNHLYGTNVWIQCFAHVLPKGKYIYWKLNPDNVEVVHPLFHRLVDQGTIKQKKSQPTWNFILWDKEVEELKLQYLQFKKKHLLR